MSNAPGDTRAWVRRITIDERLGGAFLRALVAEVKGTAEELRDDATGNWEKETEVALASDPELATKEGLVRVEEFASALGLAETEGAIEQALRQVLGPRLAEAEAPGSKGEQHMTPRQQLWQVLEEGQVFLVGCFEPCGATADDPYPLRPRKGAQRLLRIDHLPAVRDTMRKLYATALAGKEVQDA